MNENLGQRHYWQPREGRLNRSFSLGTGSIRQRQAEEAALLVKAVIIKKRFTEQALEDFKKNPGQTLADERATKNWKALQETIEYEEHRTREIYGDPLDITAYTIGMAVLNRALRLQFESEGKQTPNITIAARKKLDGSKTTSWWLSVSDAPNPQEMFRVQQAESVNVIPSLLVGLTERQVKAFFQGAQDFNYMLQKSVLAQRSSGKKS